MKTNTTILSLALACLLSVGCQIDADGSGAATLNLMNRMEADQIAHEKAGDPPPKGYASWRAYWHKRLATMGEVAERPGRGSGSLSHLGRENVAFIKRQRAAAGLPPVE